MNLVVVGLNHKTAPVAIRERMAFEESDLAAAAGRILSEGMASEAVVVSTCNRVELYAACRPGDSDAGAAGLRAFLASDRGHPVDPAGIVYQHVGRAALEHLFRVVSGLDSLVLGETEILGQMKRAYALALEAGLTGPVLNRAFQRAFATAKRIRAGTHIQRGHTSVAAVAVGLAERMFQDLDRREVLVIGSGDTGAGTARALRARGVRSICVSNRSPAGAEALAAELDARAVAFGDWEAEFAGIDIVLSATGSPRPILDRSAVERLVAGRGTRPLLLVDLAVPRDIDPGVATIPGVFLANIDDLQSVADAASRLRLGEIRRCEEILREEADLWEERRQDPRTTGSPADPACRPPEAAVAVSPCP